MVLKGATQLKTNRLFKTFVWQIQQFSLPLNIILPNNNTNSKLAKQENMKETTYKGYKIISFVTSAIKVASFAANSLCYLTTLNSQFPLNIYLLLLITTHTDMRWIGFNNQTEWLSETNFVSIVCLKRNK